MANNLFGADIRGNIARAIGPNVLPAILKKIKRVPNPNKLTGPPLEDIKTFQCRGFVEMFSERAQSRENVLEDDRRVILIGGTLPDGIFPEQGDTILIEDVDRAQRPFIVMSLIDRDPDAATYTVHVRA